jgi:SAM-dependent methyltransferase
MSALTTPDHWDDYWDKVLLPVAVAPGAATSTTAILNVIDRFASSPSPLSVLEIGGAPGGYLVHLWRAFGHEVCVLDSSPAGIELTRKNFELLGVPGRVLERDMFGRNESNLTFDIVYSLGLIEHFQDISSVIDAHLRYTKPGGTLIIGCPNFRGVNRILLRRLSPSLLSWHNLDAMNVHLWSHFEHQFELDVRFRGYVAGFQPAAFWRYEHPSVFNRALSRVLAEIGRRMTGRLGTALSHWNSPLWSYYAMGVYRTRD